MSYHFKIGHFEALSISGGAMSVSAYPTYAPNAERAEVERVLYERFLPPNQYTLQLNALVVATGSNKVLVDTGAGTEFGPSLGRLATNLQSVGIQPEDIDTVILTHAHPDHIGGIVAPDGALTFPNAQYSISEAEWTFWTAPDLNVRLARLEEAFKPLFLSAAHRHLSSIADRVTLYRRDQEIVPGIHALAAPGHTPGHSALLIASGDAQLLHTADVFHHAAFDLEHPHWQTAFDYDPAQAYATRRQLLDRAAADRTHLMAYHIPFPGVGHIRARGGHYEWEPTPWQFDL